MHLNYFVLLGVSLSLLSCAPGAAGDRGSRSDAVFVPAAGLICQSLTAPAEGASSCDTLCAAQGAACTAVNVTGLNVTAPGLSCAASAVPSVSLCRCCAVTR
jgi:hypothetical protein